MKNRKSVFVVQKRETEKVLFGGDSNNMNMVFKMDVSCVHLFYNNSDKSNRR